MSASKVLVGISVVTTTFYGRWCLVDTIHVPKNSNSKQFHKELHYNKFQDLVEKLGISDIHLPTREGSVVNSNLLRYKYLYDLRID